MNFKKLVGTVHLFLGLASGIIVFIISVTGCLYAFKDETIKSDKKWLRRFNELSLGLEIFNLFNNQNAITNTWVRDVYTKSQYGIPNYMTTRVFNLKLVARL